MHNSLGIKKELPGWEDNQKLASIILFESSFASESLNNWKREGQSFSRASPIFGYNVFALIYCIEGFILDGEKLLNSFVIKNFDHLFIFDKVGELTFVRVVAISLNALRV